MIPPSDHERTETEARLLRTARSYRAPDHIRRSTLEAVNAALATGAGAAATKGAFGPVRQMLSSPKLALGVLVLGVGFAAVFPLQTRQTGEVREPSEASEASQASQRAHLEPPALESAVATPSATPAPVAAAPSVPTVPVADTPPAPAMPRPAEPTRRTTPTREETRARVAEPAEGAAGSPAAAVERAPTDSLLAEIAALDRVRRALKQKDAIAALDALDAHRRRFPSGALHPEATALRVEALLARGDEAKARALAETFLAEHATSPLAPRVRALIGATKD